MNTSAAELTGVFIMTGIFVVLLGALYVAVSKLTSIVKQLQSSGDGASSGGFAQGILLTAITGVITSIVASITLVIKTIVDTLSDIQRMTDGPSQQTPAAPTPTAAVTEAAATISDLLTM